jgi:hypothetical protein
LISEEVVIEKISRQAGVRSLISSWGFWLNISAVRTTSIMRRISESPDMAVTLIIPFLNE